MCEIIAECTSDVGRAKKKAKSWVKWTGELEDARSAWTTDREISAND